MCNGEGSLSYIGSSSATARRPIWAAAVLIISLKAAYCLVRLRRMLEFLRLFKRKSGA